MAWKDTFEKYLKQGVKNQIWLIAKIALLLRNGYINQDEHDEIESMINEHFGA